MFVVAHPGFITPYPLCAQLVLVDPYGGLPDQGQQVITVLALTAATAQSTAVAGRRRGRQLH